MRTMYDALSTQAAAIPADAELVAGYIDAGPNPAAPPWTSQQWDLFPHAIHVPIATQAATDDGVVLDVEAGDATPDQAPGWCARARVRGVTPTVYCSASAWPTVRDQFAAQGVAEPCWWIASYQQPPDTSIPAGAVAHQWGGNAAGTYDVSSVVDYWPGVDPAPQPWKGEHVDLFSTTEGETVTYYRDAGGILVPLDPGTARAFFPGLEDGRVQVWNLATTPAGAPIPAGIAAVAWNTATVKARKAAGVTS